MEEGSLVRPIVPVITGTIIDTQWNKSAKEVEHLVEWTDADGEVQQRWFLQSGLEKVTA